jgi:hypothetical protein
MEAVALVYGKDRMNVPLSPDEIQIKTHAIHPIMKLITI